MKMKFVYCKYNFLLSALILKLKSFYFWSHLKKLDKLLGKGSAAASLLRLVTILAGCQENSLCRVESAVSKSREMSRDSAFTEITNCSEKMM